jgi:transcriptional antiterminator NusG
MHRHCGSLPDPLRWYCIQSHPGAEREAAVRLRDQGFITFVPVVLVERRRQFVARPALPRYLFVAFDVAAMKWRSVCHTLGVQRLFMFGSFEPAPARRGDVERLACHLGDLLGQADPTSLPVENGATGHVAAGPFTGFACTVQGTEDDGRLVVRVNIFGRPTDVTLERDAVRLSEEGAGRAIQRGGTPHPLGSSPQI